MTNNLKNFLEGEYRSFGTDYGEPIGFKEGAKFCCGGDYCDGNHLEDMQDLKNHDTRLINFVLDLVEKEVGKLPEVSGCVGIFMHTSPTEAKEWCCPRHYGQSDISTIINNLRV